MKPAGCLTTERKLKLKHGRAAGTAGELQLRDCPHVLATFVAALLPAKANAFIHELRVAAEKEGEAAQGRPTQLRQRGPALAVIFGVAQEPVQDMGFGPMLVA